MESRLKCFTFPVNKANQFQGELPEYGLVNMGFHGNDEGYWIAYHHHDSGTSIVVEYDEITYPDKAMLRIRGLEETIERTLDSLNELNLEIVEDN